MQNELLDSLHFTAASITDKMPVVKIGKVISIE